MMTKLKLYELKYVFPPNKKGERHLRVLAANEEEALLMRSYLLYEGFEGREDILFRPRFDCFADKRPERTCRADYDCFD